MVSWVLVPLQILLLVKVVDGNVSSVETYFDHLLYGMLMDPYLVLEEGNLVLFPIILMLILQVQSWFKMEMYHPMIRAFPIQQWC